MAALTEDQISKLTAAGAKRWTKYGKDRLYIDAKVLGLELDCYRTGNISSARWQGAAVSNADGGRLSCSKVYVDVATGELSVYTSYTNSCDPNANVRDVAERFVAAVLADDDDEDTGDDADAATDDAETAEAVASDDADADTEDSTDAPADDGADVSSAATDAATASDAFAAKAAIVRKGGSVVFANWARAAGITEEEFLDALRWVCGDPHALDGKLTREVGLVITPDARTKALMTSDAPEAMKRAFGGAWDEGKARGRIVRLTRHYDSRGEFAGLYTAPGRRWPGSVSLNARDHV